MLPSHVFRTNLRAALLLPLVLVAAGRAESMPLVQEMALHSMLESTTSVFSTLRDYAVLNPDGISNGSGVVAAGSAINWSGSFNSAGWSYNASGVFSGMALSMSYAGVVSGSNASDVTVTVTGTGSLRTPGSQDYQPLAMGGFSTWKFDSDAQDYLEMDFEQDTKIGANSSYGRVKGREKIYCVLDGQVVGGGSLPPIVAGAPVELVGWASSGKTSKSRYPTANGYSNGTKDCHLAPTQLTSAASSGKRGIVTVSTVVISLLSSGGFDVIVMANPAAIAPGHEFDPSNQATVVGVDGAMYADDARNQFRSTGQYLDDDVNGGTFSGTLTSVPEPSSVLLVAVALALLPRGGQVSRLLL